MIDLTGRVFGRLTVVRRDGSYRGQVLWKCSCSCGGAASIPGYPLRVGTTKSCGCLRVETAKGMSQGNRTHGSTKTPTYGSWKAMVERCTAIGSKDYPRYGGRGITVCERWLKFENFIADMGERPEGKTLDRFPKQDGNYEPGNCRWATPQQQADNRRTTKVIEFNGIRDSIAGWARRLGIHRNCMAKRLKKWPIERALTEESRGY